MTTAPPVLPALACGGSVERRPEGPAESGSSLLSKLTRLRMVAPQRARSREAIVCAPTLLLAWVAAKDAWTVTRSDF